MFRQPFIKLQSTSLWRHRIFMHCHPIFPWLPCSNLKPNSWLGYHRKLANDSWLPLDHGALILWFLEGLPFSKMTANHDWVPRHDFCPRMLPLSEEISQQMIVIAWWKKILHHLVCIEPNENPVNEIGYLSTGVVFLPSRVVFVSHCIFFFEIVEFWGF